MRTVSLEFPTEVLEKLGVLPPGFFARFEELELLETLRLDEVWRLQLLRLRRRAPFDASGGLGKEAARIRRQYGLERFEVVEERPRTRDYILLVRQRNPPWLTTLLELAGGEIAPTAPFRLSSEKTLATFHGTERALQKVLKRLDSEELPYRVVRSSTRPGPEPSEHELTEAQRELLVRAWTLGFYTVPRRITLTRLAKFSGKSSPALGKMLRRAEGRLVARYLAEEALGHPRPPGKD